MRGDLRSRCRPLPMDYDNLDNVSARELRELFRDLDAAHAAIERLTDDYLHAFDAGLDACAASDHCRRVPRWLLVPA